VRATTSAWFSGGFLWRRSAIWWFGVLSAWWIGWKSLLSAWWLSPLSSTSRLYLLSSAFRTSAWWIGFLSSNICNRWFRQWSSALCASTSRVCLLSSAFRTSTSRICLLSSAFSTSTSRICLSSSAFSTSAWWIGFSSSKICNRWRFRPLRNTRNGFSRLPCFCVMPPFSGIVMYWSWCLTSPRDSPAPPSRSHRSWSTPVRLPVFVATTFIARLETQRFLNYLQAGITVLCIVQQKEAY